MKKIHDQLKALVSAPPSSTPAAPPLPEAAPQMPIAMSSTTMNWAATITARANQRFRESSKFITKLQSLIEYTINPTNDDPSYAYSVTTPLPELKQPAALPEELQACTSFLLARVGT